MGARFVHGSCAHACGVAGAACEALFWRAGARRYRKFRLSEETDLVVRCELDGVMNYKGQDQLLSIKALNEFDPKITGAQQRALPAPPLACGRSGAHRSRHSHPGTDAACGKQKWL